jgi:hypothetical protein
MFMLMLQTMILAALVVALTASALNKSADAGIGAQLFGRSVEVDGR